MTDLIFDFAEINRRMNRKRPLFLPVETDHGHAPAVWTMPNSGVADLRAELDKTEYEMAGLEWARGNSGVFDPASESSLDVSGVIQQSTIADWIRAPSSPSAAVSPSEFNQAVRNAWAQGNGKPIPMKPCIFGNPDCAICNREGAK